MERNIKRNEDLRVWPAQQHEGSCQGCGTDNKVFVIQARSWQTRLCAICLEYVCKVAKR